MISAAQLPSLPPPRVADAQKHRVLKAEDAAIARARRHPLPFEEARDLTLRACAALALGAPQVTEVDGARRLTYHPGGRIDISGEWAAPDLLHTVAHHALDPIFPAHGVEFAGTLLALMERHEPAHVARAYREEFAAAGVQTEGRDRIAEVLRRAVYVANKEHGVLARIVLDGPPEELICQLVLDPCTRKEGRLAIGDGLLVYDGNLKRLAIERLRYISWRFSSTGGSRVNKEES